MPSENIGGKLTPSVGSLHGIGSVVEESLHGRIVTVPGGSGKAKWGTITGDINDQEDLMALFNNINIDDLHQDEGTFFILDCGTSTRNIEV